MVQPHPLEHLIARLRSDVLSGASEVAQRASEILERTAEEAPARSGAELTAELTRVSLQILEAQPAMAPLVTLAREVLAAATPDEPLAALRSRAAAAARHLREGMAGRTAAVAARAAALLPSAGAVLTLSASATVEAALVEAARSRPVRVVCLESRPMSEGRSAAAALARGGVEVTLAVDAALESLIPACSAVLLGADSVGDLGVVNKIGSAAAAHAAARHGIPLIVAADSSKLLPAGFPQPLDDERPAADVWQAPAGVRIWNRYFEAFPISLVGTAVTEDEALPSDALTRLRNGLAVPPALARWAASRG